MNDHPAACPRIEDLSALMDGALPHSAATELRLHAASCAACGASLQAFSELRAQLEPLRERAPDVDIAGLVLPQLARPASAARRPRAKAGAKSRRPSLWSFIPQTLGGAAALAAGAYLGLTLLAGSGAALRPAGMTAFDAEPVGALCAGLPSCSARGR